MKSAPFRLLLLTIAIGAVAGIALVAQQAQPTGGKMAEAANKFLATLPAELKAKAAFKFDDPHREKWYFTPQQDKQKQFTRKGVRLEELDEKQKAAALELLRAGLSAKGFEQATTIVSLETVLKDLEGTKGAMVRNPNWYFVSVFGEPSNTGAWGWRFEGHHLSVNVTLDKGQVVTATPIVFGVNPAEVRDGPKKGLRTVPEIEELAKQLIASLTDDQKASAKQAKQLPEIREGFPDAGISEAVGIAAGKLTNEQKATLGKLLTAYAARLPADVAATEMARVRDAGMDKVTFAYCIEEAKPGKPYTYRLHGPTFVVEFLNVQADAAGNPANHIHSGWRRLPNDFSMKGG